MKEHKGTKLPALAILVVLVLIGLAVYLLDDTREESEVQDSGGKTVEEMLADNETEEAPVLFDNKWYRRNPDVETYLLIGVDQTGEAQSSGSYNSGGQADVLLLLVVDHGQQCYTILQLNRDTMTAVDTLGVTGAVVETNIEQLALAHAYGNGLESSCENTARAVSNLLYETKIDGYLSLRMEGLPVLNDLLGGVPVTVRDDFSQIDPSLVQGETVTLRGQQVLSYIRTRHYVGNSTNLERMERHRGYMKSFSDELKNQMADDPNVVLELYAAAEPYMVTNISEKRISNLANTARNYNNRGIVTIDGENRMGAEFMEYYADENSIKETVLALFYLPV